MKLSVVILNWNQAAHTLNCIQALQTWQDLSPKIWIVDNASEEKIQKKIEQDFQGVHYILSEINRGFSGGNNLAIEQILKEKDSILLLLNNDASISEENASKLLLALETHRELGIVGPMIYESDSSQTLISMGGRDISRYIQTRNYKEDKSTLSKNVIYVDYVPGTVALIRANLFRTVGLFDENYFFSGEMADFCERAHQKGFTCAVNVQSSATHHFDSSSTIRQTLYLYYNLRNRFLFIKKFRRSKMLYLYSFWVLYGALLFLGALVRFQKKRAKAIGFALIDGVHGKFGNQNDKFLP